MTFKMQLWIQPEKRTRFVTTKRLLWENKYNYLKWKSWKIHYDAWKEDILDNHPEQAWLVGYSVREMTLRSLSIQITSLGDGEPNDPTNITATI